jgi:Family of unknown function (DUF6065)
MLFRRLGRSLARLIGPPAAVAGAAPKLIAYLNPGQTVAIEPAPLERDWMSATPQRFAYRCLPLNVANTYGWEILCDGGFTATWNGGNGLDAISIQTDSGTPTLASSHFGHGILTFGVPCLFATDPGFDLMVQGPINRPKDAIAPLTGLVETDWSPYTFTMNWLFTRQGAPVRFEKDEPFCHIFPLRRGDVESVVPEFRQQTENPQLKIQRDAWEASRLQFNADLSHPDSKAKADKWQKRYYHGLDMEGRDIAPDHRTKVRVRPFAR